MYTGVKPHLQGQHEWMTSRLVKCKTHFTWGLWKINMHLSKCIWVVHHRCWEMVRHTCSWWYLPEHQTEEEQLRLVFQITRNITPLTLIMFDITKLWYIIWFYKWLQQWNLIPNTSKVWITMLTRKWICCIFVETWNGAGGMEMTMEIPWTITRKKIMWPSICISGSLFETTEIRIPGRSYWQKSRLALNSVFCVSSTPQSYHWLFTCVFPLSCNSSFVLRVFF